MSYEGLSNEELEKKIFWSSTTSSGGAVIITVGWLVSLSLAGGPIGFFGALIGTAGAGLMLEGTISEHNQKDELKRREKNENKSNIDSL